MLFFIIPLLNFRKEVICIKITPKQDKFCRNLVSGMSAKDAYKNAYDTNSDNAAQVEAVKLVKREDIQERLAELRRPIENLIQSDCLSEYEKLKTLALDRLKLAIDRNDDTIAIKYMDIINKMIGSYVNINHNINDNKPELIANLDTDKLKKLLE